MNKKHPLLGDWKPSSEWYTPDHIVKKVCNTFDSDIIFDPCPPRENTAFHKGMFYSESDPLKDAINQDWGRYKYVYCNPPTPAQLWAKKALETIETATLALFLLVSQKR